MRPPKPKERRRVEDKFGKSVAKFGYNAIPNLLLRAQGKLKLTPEMLNVLFQIMEHWREADRAAFPSKDRLATRMGKSPRQVQRYLTQLEDGGFLKRIPRFSGIKAQKSNAYDLDGLVAKLKAIEPEFTKTAELERLRRRKVEMPSG
jgi:hypothetical protein